MTGCVFLTKLIRIDKKSIIIDTIVNLLEKRSAKQGQEK